MFPSFNFEQAMEQAEEDQKQKIKIELMEVPRLIFDIKGKGHTVLENGKISMCKTTKEKVQMYIQMLLRTTKDKYKVYKDTGFGTTYMNYRGTMVSETFISSELKRELTEQLNKLNVFDSLIRFNAYKEADNLHVAFTVILKNKEKINIVEVVKI